MGYMETPICVHILRTINVNLQIFVRLGRRAQISQILPFQDIGPISIKGAFHDTEKQL